MIIDDQIYSTILSFVLVLIIVWIQFKSLKNSLYSMVPIIAGVMANYILMFIFHIKFDVVTAIFASVTVGVGVDDAIHFMLRYQRQKTLHPQLPYYIVMQRTLQETGRPIILTSTSISAGMLMLAFAILRTDTVLRTAPAFSLFAATLATVHHAIGDATGTEFSVFRKKRR
jgi:predicted RND superfamily exporter protein